MGELAVGAVDLAPLAEQRHDLGDLVGEQAVHWAAARRVVLELVSGAAAKPPEGPHLTKLQHLAGGAERPSLLDGLLQQPQQAGLGGLIHPSGTRPLSPSARFPPPASA